MKFFISQNYLLISTTFALFLVVDLMVYDATFDGMKLAGIIIICCGFLVVLFPENWPDLLQSLIRYVTTKFISLKCNSL